LGCFGGTTSEGNTNIIQKETQNQVDISFPDLDAVHVWNFKQKHFQLKITIPVCLFGSRFRPGPHAREVIQCQGKQSCKPTATTSGSQSAKSIIADSLPYTPEV